MAVWFLAEASQLLALLSGGFRCLTEKLLCKSNSSVCLDLASDQVGSVPLLKWSKAAELLFLAGIQF